MILLSAVSWEPVCGRNPSMFLARCMRKLKLLPAYGITIPREYQNGEVIQVTDGSRSRNDSVLVVNPEGRWTDPLSVADDAGCVRVVRHTAAKE